MQHTVLYISLPLFSTTTTRGGEWYVEKRGSRKIFAGSRNLGSVFDKSRSLVFAWFVFTFFESRNFLPKSLGLGFLTRISASRRVSDFTIRHPYNVKLPSFHVSWRKCRMCSCYLFFFPHCRSFSPWLPLVVLIFSPPR